MITVGLLFLRVLDIFVFSREWVKVQKFKIDGSS